MRHEVEIDTEIAVLHGAYIDAEFTVSRLAGYLTDLFAEYPKGWGARKVVPTIQEAMAKVDSGEVKNTLKKYNIEETSKKYLSNLREAMKVSVDARAAWLEAEKKYGGWSRFFLVNNSNGHIHSSMNCSTCFISTQFMWLPSLSGLTEKDAVDEHGTRLCSVCFPTAPVEWTLGMSDAAKGYCPGKTVPQSGYRVGMRYYAKCDKCGGKFIQNQNGSLRKHKTKEKK